MWKYLELLKCIIIIIIMTATVFLLLFKTFLLTKTFEL